MGKHAKLAPSAASRWMPCPGSIALCAKVPKSKASGYAQEGTAAHELAAELLLNRGDAAADVGRKIQVDDKVFVVDEDMAEAVQVYLDTIRCDIEHCFSKKTTVMKVEKSFALTWMCKDMFGTNDCSLFDSKEKKLYVYDYKHGAGVLVDVEWNPQLLIYALGALYEAWDIDEMLPVTASVEEVEIVIVQPRIDTEEGVVRRWKILTEDLLYWALHVLRPSALRTEEDNAKLSAGDHCRFCDAGAVCPEKAKTAAALAKTDFAKPVLPSPEDMTPEMVIAVLGKVGMFSKWADQVKDFAFAQMQQGKDYPGYKLVRRKSNRKWIDVPDTEIALINVLGDNAFSRKILSVAQVEKVLKEAGLSPEATLDGLWEKPDTGLTMVSETDKRKAVSATADAALDFAEEDFLS